MARTEGVVAVTEGSGKNLHTISTDFGGTTKEDQVVQQSALHYLPKYFANGTAISTATSASHLFALEADGTNYLLVTRIYIAGSDDVPAAAALAQLQIFRTTTASLTGTALNPRPASLADTSPYAGRCVSLPGTKGTEGDFLMQGRIGLGTTATAHPPTWEWKMGPGEAPIVVGAAVTAGLVIKIVTGIASAALDYTVEFFVSPSI